MGGFVCKLRGGDVLPLFRKTVTARSYATGRGSSPSGRFFQYIVISNDIFADKTVLSYLHIAYGVLNARTLGTPLLQAMQNGPSVYLDSRGRLTFLTKPYEQVIGLRVAIQ
jgi:hypothetical protein